MQSRRSLDPARRSRDSTDSFLPYGEVSIQCPELVASPNCSSEYRFELDQDDDYPLSGLVKLKPDAKKDGVWSGNYEEFAGGQKVKRWRFEMRKIEEQVNPFVQHVCFESEYQRENK